MASLSEVPAKPPPHGPACRLLESHLQESSFPRAAHDAVHSWARTNNTLTGRLPDVKNDHICNANDSPPEIKEVVHIGSLYPSMRD